MGSSSLSIRLVALAIFVSLLFTCSSGHGRKYDPFTQKPKMEPHEGPMLTGTVNLAIMWYGDVGIEIENTMRDFIKSIGLPAPPGVPHVSCWWGVVESYQSIMPRAPPGPPPKITVNIAKQAHEKSYKHGKVLTLQQHVKQLIDEVSQGDPHVIPVIVAAKDVSIQGLCHGRCADHALTEDPKPRPYIVVGNPEIECPGECAWPFHPSSCPRAPKGPVLKPPNGHMAADAMVASFAGALANAVTNPYDNGFYHCNFSKRLGPVCVCKGIYGSGAAPGNPGKVQTDPQTGGNFNALGDGNKKYLLPAIWNPKTNACWTL